MTKEKKKKKRSPIGCLVAIVLFIIFIVFGVRMMGKMYDDAEKKLNRESFEKVHARFVSLPAVVSLNLSEIEIRTLTVKFFLVKNCEGGEETMKKLIAYEQNILYDACRNVQNNNFFSNKLKENKNHEKEIKQLLETDFKGAVKLYDWYINE